MLLVLRADGQARAGLVGAQVLKVGVLQRVHGADALVRRVAQHAAQQVEPLHAHCSRNKRDL